MRGIRACAATKLQSRRATGVALLRFGERCSAVATCLAVLRAMAARALARLFQFGQFVSAKHLCEFAFGAFADGFHLSVGAFAGCGVAALAFHRFHHGATLALRVGHNGGDLGSARSVKT